MMPVFLFTAYELINFVTLRATSEFTVSGNKFKTGKQCSEVLYKKLIYLYIYLYIFIYIYIYIFGIVRLNKVT